jgi:hypothetical protein
MGMMISKVNYSQNVGWHGEWHLKDLSLGKLNLIVGKNAVGKTRAMNITNALAGMISGKSTKLLNGNWDVTFKSERGLWKYVLRIDKGMVVEETLRGRRRSWLSRRRSEGTIDYCMDGQIERRKFYPPENKLTNQVRRDIKELPYLEELTKWGENYHFYRFSSVRPDELLVMSPSESGVSGLEAVGENLGVVPYLLEKVQNDRRVKLAIMEDVKKIGYRTDDLSAVVASLPGVPPGLRVIQLREEGIGFPITQTELSQGMYRVIAIVVVINYLMATGTGGTVAVDDLGEGLDFERSSRLAELIFKKAKRTDIQLIVTSNDRFLMNAVDVKCWNVLERRGTVVRSFNYGNSKRVFDEFALVGLNNFDLFASELYKDKADD